MTAIAITLELMLASALLVAAFGKFTAWGRWREARTELRLDVPAPLWTALPFLEMGVGTGLALGLRPFTAPAALLLFVVFAVALAVSYRRGARGECNCLGALLPTQVGPWAILRALGLALIAAALVFAGPTTSSIHPVGLAGAVVLAAVVILVGSVRAMAFSR